MLATPYPKAECPVGAPFCAKGFAARGAPTGTEISDNPEAFKGVGTQARVPCLGAAPLTEAANAASAGATPRTNIGVQLTRKTIPGNKAGSQAQAVAALRATGMGCRSVSVCGMWPGGQGSGVWTDAQTRELGRVRYRPYGDFGTPDRVQA